MSHYEESVEQERAYYDQQQQRRENTQTKLIQTLSTDKMIEILFSAHLNQLSMAELTRLAKKEVGGKK